MLAQPTPHDVILLALHGLAPVDVRSGEWPIGNFEQFGMEALEAIGYGRISTSHVPSARDVAVAKLYAAGLGESERGLRVAAYAQVAENRLLCRLSAVPNAWQLAWLSF